ncbi:hypothetical protein [Alkalicoccus chagannorensis]|uniref:hypothetical protein n=1 Tax=Alkalicoccus chagannorensis TaxID=427072 RepID=UPI00042A2010|nr:hypothetical protein [Alkalicoccus chagannorensis]
MKKWLMILVVSSVLLAGGGWAAYQYGTSYAADRLMEGTFGAELEQGAAELRNHPEFGRLMEAWGEENHPVKEELPVQTRDEAAKLVLSKFSAGEIAEAAGQLSRGITAEEQKELEAKAKERLSDEELEALLFIGLEELE